MERIILKSKREPIEIHIIGHDAIEHCKDKIESTSPFCGVYLDNPKSWEKNNIVASPLDHVYEDGSAIQLGDRVEIEIAKKTTKRGKIVFLQSAYGIQMFESGIERFTPLCCFSDSVKITKLALGESHV